MPRPTGHLKKRHYYQCGDLTLSWQSDWYTQSWFTQYRQSYDQAASTGPVDPPLTIIETVPVCSSLLSQALASTSTLPVPTRTSGSSPTTAASSFTSGVTAATPMITSSSHVVSSTPSLSSTVPSLGSAATDPSSINACAGDWDFQGWATVASTGVGVIIGGLIWLVWGILRSKMPALYSPRTWFIPPESRPSRPFSLLAFLLPFLHPPSLSSSTPLSEGELGLHTMLAALKLGAFSSLLALGAALPIIIVGVPCLSETAPSNNLGGRLGTLTDLSLLRLLDALDPSRNSISSSNQLHLQPYSRDLPSTIAPAISDARVRLIILLVLMALLLCGGGLFVIARTYAAFARYQKRFEEEICGGLEMVIIPAEKAVAWKGLPEDGVKKWLTRHFKGEKEQKSDMEVVGVFAIPDTSAWQDKLTERDKSLACLEEAETKYIEAGGFGPSLPDATVQKSAREITAQPAEESPLIPLSPKVQGETENTVPGSSTAEQSRFKEINRNSSLYEKRFSIGQRIKVDDKGVFLPDPSPESEGNDPLGPETEESRHSPPLLRPGHRELSAPTPDASPRGSPGHRGRLIEQTETSPQGSEVEIAIINPGPARRPELQPTPGVVSSAHPSQEDMSPSRRSDSDIRDTATCLKASNANIKLAQQQTFGSIAKGESVRGWVLIGRKMRFLPYAQSIAGNTREDILWSNVGQRTGLWSFSLQITLIGAILSLVMVPFIGLTVASTPAFAHYLPFLGPIARSDGFGSGVVQGLIPANALSFAIGLSVVAVSHSARKVKIVSKTSQEMLAFKAIFYLILSVTVLWLLAVTALEYAVQGFALNVQEGRTVGDGAVYSTWFIFIAILNIAVTVPGLYLLRPRRLLVYWRERRKVNTPRQIFRAMLPRSFDPSYGLLPGLIAVFYAVSLLLIFPLIAIPILLILLLSMMANRYMIDYVCVQRTGYAGAVIGLWTIRRFGWVLGIQPALFGLILLSRREWGLGATGLAVSVTTVLLAEGLTVLRYPKRRLQDLPHGTQQLLASIRRNLEQPPSRSTMGETSRPRISDSSMLLRLNTLLPGLSRLPADCPLPLPTEDIDDVFFTEKAAHHSPERRNSDEETTARYFYDPTASLRGLVYPPEILAPAPVVWLQRDEAGLAEEEAAELEAFYGLHAVVTPRCQ